MAIVTLWPKFEQSLLEYQVGGAVNGCTFPGIAQCFAIAGWVSTGLLCTHVSPGATKEDIANTFAVLRQMGGKNVLHWYVVGPFSEHFAVAKAQWRSVAAIRRTFDKELANKAANRFILDATEERNTKVLEEGFTIQRTWNSIDVRAEHRMDEEKVAFAYKEGGHRTNDWTQFEVGRLVRF